jgi:hypothetical protein
MFVHIGKPSCFNIPPDIGFTLFTPIKGRIDSLTVYIYKGETCTNILRYNTCNQCFQPLPISMAARITKYLNKYVRRGICLIYMSSFYFWSPSFARKIRKTNMLIVYFWLAPQVLWNDLRGIVIKQRHWQTFWDIIHVDQATLRTGSCLLRSAPWLE